MLLDECLLAIVCSGMIAAQEPADPPPSDVDPQRAALEAKLAAELSGAQLVGQFTVVGQDKTGAPEEERYTIQSVSKVEGYEDLWNFVARIQYGGRDATVPIPLQVKWAGDTPVVTLTDLKIPGLGTYTARVLFYRGQYAGTWSAGDHGGHLFGRIVRPDPAPAEGSAQGEDRDGEGRRSPPLGQAQGSPFAWIAAASVAMAGPAGPPKATNPRAGQEGAAGPAAAGAASPDAIHWPSFRGPKASGVSEGGRSAVTWNVETGENVAWIAEIPGLAHSSPVIWGDAIYLTSAVPEESTKDPDLKVGLYGSIEPVEDEGVHDFNVYCVDRESGDILWCQTAHTGVPAIKRHPKGSHAAMTPATDGRHVVAFFASEGLYCYNVEGELLWKRDFGVLDAGYYAVPDAQWGSATSPVIHGDHVVLQCDVQKGSFLALLDLKTGEDVWRVARDEVPTWSSPTVDVRPGRSQIIVNGWKHMGGYDLETGKELWKLAGGGDIPVPTPIVAGDLIFLTSAHGRVAPILAIDAMAQGTLALEPKDSAHVKWSRLNRGNYMQTPLVYGDLLYCCSDAGILACYDAKTGEEKYRQRLSEGGFGFTASAVACDGKLYFTSETGEIFVVAAGPKYELLAANSMSEECMATPALSEGRLFVRTRRSLVAISDAAEGR